MLKKEKKFGRINKFLACQFFLLMKKIWYFIIIKLFVNIQERAQLTMYIILHNWFFSDVHNTDLLNSSDVCCKNAKNILSSFVLCIVWSYRGDKVNQKRSTSVVQCPSLNRLTLCQYKSDINNQMIQLTVVFCILLRYKWASNFWLQ